MSGESSPKKQSHIVLSADLRRSFFKLYHAINTMEFRSNAVAHGDLAYRDIMYLSIIMFMDECTVTKLVDLLHITKPAVTVKINNLVERGLVIKQKSETDSRVNYLMASPATYAIYAKEDRRINLALEYLASNYTPEEIEKFSEMLRILSDGLVETESK